MAESPNISAEIEAFIRRTREKKPHLRLNVLGSQVAILPLPRKRRAHNESIAARFWNWSATWRWLEFIVLGLYGGAMAVDEYIVAIIFGCLAAFGALSRLLHEQDWSKARKISGCIGILIVWFYLMAISVAKLGEKPASNLVILWDRYAQYEKAKHTPPKAITPQVTTPPTGETPGAQLPPSKHVAPVSTRHKIAPPPQEPTVSVSELYVGMSDGTLGSVATDEATKIRNLYSNWWNGQDEPLYLKQVRLPPQSPEVQHVWKQRLQVQQQAFIQNRAEFDNAIQIRNECFKRPSLAEQAKQLASAIGLFYDKEYNWTKH